MKNQPVNLEWLPCNLTMREALTIIDSLRPHARGRYSWAEIRHRIRPLLGQNFFLFYDVPSFPMIRGRVVPLREPGKSGLLKQVRLLNNVSDLGPLPDEKVYLYGRCHLPGTGMFYAAFNEETVLAELHPDTHSIVYFLTCEPKDTDGFSTIVLGEFDHFRRHGVGTIFHPDTPFAKFAVKWLSEMKTEDHYVKLVIDAFFGWLMSSPANSQDDYKITSALCALLMDLNTDFPGNAESIFYPSVAHPGGQNIAITNKAFKAKVKPVSCKAVHVLNNFGFGIYKTHVIATSEKISSEGEITWTPCSDDPKAIADSAIPI